MDRIYSEQEFKNLTNLGFFHRRDHKKLTLIDSLLRKYHSENSLNEAATVLINIVVACQDFYYEQPQNSRVRAVIELHHQALTRVKNIVKQNITSHSLGYKKESWKRAKAAITPLVRGAKSQSKLLSEQYWPEALVKEHFPLIDIVGSRNPFEIWKTTTTDSLNYVEWLKERYIPDTLETERGQQLLLRFSNRVQYLDKYQREEKKIHIENGFFFNSLGEKFHTGGMETNVAGKGWAIYIRSTKNEIYAYTHQQNVFHHSSFVSGAPVYSAGEIAVDNGRLIGITNKSGHYKPEISHCYNMMDYLLSHNVALKGVAVCLVTLGRMQGFYDAEELLQDKTNLPSRIIAKPQVL